MTTYNATSEYWQKLKDDFAKDSESTDGERLDADNDEGYFVEWLVERLYKAEKTKAG